MNLASVLRAAGCSVVEYPGWEKRGRPGSFSPRAVFVHHDASPVGATPGNARFIAEIGRPSEGIPAPLSQLWVCLGCNGAHEVGSWHVLAAGRANHGGTGPGWGVVPRDGGNTYAYGIETDHTTGETVDPRLYHSLCVGVAALLNAMNAHAGDACMGHKEYAPGRKSDPDWDMAQMRRDVLKFQADPQTPNTREDFLMALSDAEQTEVLNALRYLMLLHDVGPGIAKGEVTTNTRSAWASVYELSAHLVPGLQKSQANIATVVTDSVKDALAKTPAASTPNADAFAQEVLSAVQARLDKAAE